MASKVPNWFEELHKQKNVAKTAKTFELKDAKWRGELLKDLPIKAYGRSYDDKLKNFVTKDLGGNPTELNMFVKWMNMQESTAGNEVKQPTFKKPQIKQASGDVLQSKINEAMGFNKASSTRNRPENTTFSNSAAQNQAPKEDNWYVKGRKKIDDNFFKPIGDTVGRFATGVSNALTLGQTKKQSENRDLPSFLQDWTSPADSVPEHIADFAGSAVGEAGLFATGYGALARSAKATQALNKIPKIASEAIRGFSVGTGVGIAKGTADALTEEDYKAKDFLFTVGVEAALGAGGDALFAAGGVALKQMAKSIYPHLNDTQAMQELVEEFIKIGNQKIEVEGLPHGQANPTQSRIAPNPDAPKDLAFLNDVLNPQQTKQQDLEKLMEDMDLVSSDVRAKEAQAITEVPQVAKNDGLDQFRNRDLTPDDMQTLQARAQEIETNLAEGPKKAVQENKAYQKKVAEVESVAEAQAKYRADKDFAKEVLPFFNQHGKFEVNGPEYDEFASLIPTSFRVGKGQKTGLDIYKMAELAFEAGHVKEPTPDALVDLITNFNIARKSKLKDYTPPGLEKYANKEGRKQLEKEMGTIEKLAESKYRVTNKAEIAKAQAELDEVLGLIQNPMARTEAETAATSAFKEGDYAKAQQSVLDALEQDFKTTSQKGNPFSFLETKQPDLPDMSGGPTRYTKRDSQKLIDELINPQPKAEPKKADAINTQSSPKEIDLKTVKFDKDVADMNEAELRQSLEHLVNKKQELKTSDNKGFEDVYQRQLDSVDEDITNLKEFMKQKKSNTPTDSLHIVAGQKADEYADSPFAEPRGSLKDKIESGEVSLVKTARDLRRNLDSDTNDLKQLERELLKNDVNNILNTWDNGKQVVSEDSLYKQTRELRKSLARAIESANSSYKPIFKILKDHNISRLDFENYAAAMHYNDIYKGNKDKIVRQEQVYKELQELQLDGGKEALAKEQKLLKELDELEPYTVNMSEEWVDGILANHGNNDPIQKAHEILIKEQRKDIDMRVEAGLYTPEEAEAMFKAHPNYISLRRAEDLGTGTGGKNPTRVKRSVKHRTTGSEDKILPVLDSAYMNRIIAQADVDKANVMRTLEKLEVIQGSEKYFVKVNKDDPGFDITKTIRGFDNGKEVFYEVPQALRNIFENMNSSNPENIAADALKGLATLMKKGTTHMNIPFHLYAGTRDSFAAIFASRTGAHLGHTVLGFLDSFMGKNLEKISGGKFKSYRDVYKEMGGEMSGFISMDQYSIHKVTEAMKKGKIGKDGVVLNPFKAAEKFGQKMEHGPRLGEFRAAKAKGLTDADASFEATDIIDYADMGATTRKLNPYDPYLGATQRGNIRMLQAMKENPKKALATGAMYITMPTVSLYALRYAPTTNDVQRDKIHNMKEWEKNTLWAIPVPNTDKIWYMPKPFVLGQIFANPVERALDYAFGETLKTKTDIAKATGMDFLQTFTPPTSFIGLTMMFELGANVDSFTWFPIEDAEMQREVDKTERYNAFTSEVAKTLGKKTKQSPAKIDHVIKKHTGGLGRDALDIIDNLSSKSGERPAKVNTILDTLDPTKRFKHKDTSSSGIYDFLYKKQKEDTASGLKKSPAKTAYKEMQTLNKEIKAIRESHKLTASDKKKQVTTLRDKQRKIGSKYLKNSVK